MQGWGEGWGLRSDYEWAQDCFSECWKCLKMDFGDVCTTLWEC